MATFLSFLPPCERHTPPHTICTWGTATLKQNQQHPLLRQNGNIISPWISPNVFSDIPTEFGLPLDRLVPKNNEHLFPGATLKVGYDKIWTYVQKFAGLNFKPVLVFPLELDVSLSNLLRNTKKNWKLLTFCLTGSEHNLLIFAVGLSEIRRKSP